jgi:hypothetical protein
MNDLAYVVSSFYKFKELWKPHFLLFKKYFPDFKGPMYLITDKSDESFSIDDVIIISTNETLDFSNRLLKGIKAIKEDYLFLSFDDYFLKKQINSSKFYSIYSFFVNKGIDYLNFYKQPISIFEKKNVFNKLRFNEYDVNFYPSFWKKNSLLKILSDSKATDPWNLEVSLTSLSLNYKFLIYSYFDKNFYPFIDVIRKGKLLKSAAFQLDKEKISLNSFKKTTFIFELKLNMLYFLKSLLPFHIRLFLKYLLKKLGFKFHT